MREIKFRAWDKKYHKMYYGDIRAALAYPDENVVIEQFTGLRDVYGVEVYEGDIIRIDNEIIGGAVIDGEMIFNTDPTLGNLEWGLWTDKGYHRTDFLGGLEVIGTVHELPKEGR
jgi:hypothetical protein